MAGEGERRGADQASMLIEFRASNVRSFRDPVELNLLATRLSEEGVPREVQWREDGRSISVLPAAGIFGANASGKSNLLKAMNDMRSLVLSSFSRNAPDGRMLTAPFLLGEDEGHAPSLYEIVLVLNGIRHDYGFVVDSTGVKEEWARNYPRGRAVTLLQRTGDNIHIGSEHRAKSRATQEILRRNALFLSTAAATNHPLFLPLYEWFRRNLTYADVESRSIRQAITAEMLEGDRRRQVLALLREADLGITDVSQRAVDPEHKERIKQLLDMFWDEDSPQMEFEKLEINDFEVALKHRSATKDVELAEEDESRGTIVWVDRASN
jgi:hypothetical protein